MSSPLAQFELLLYHADFLFVVYYRGHWCPFSIAYLKELQSLTSSILAANGRPLIVTAEPEQYMAKTRAATGYHGAAIVDPEHSLARDLQDQGFVNVVVSERNGYEHGMAQPAVLVIKNDRTVLYSWAVEPSLKNLGGAKDQPSLTQIWENINAQMHGEPAVHATYATQGIMTGVREKLFG